MASSPNQPQTGKQYELRVAASALDLDKRVSALTLPGTRASLPGFLHFYSERQFQLTVDDRDIDGHSFTETQFRGFQMRITNHNRNKYPLDPEIEKVRLTTGDKGLRIRMSLQLGIQGASELMIHPFFTAEERERGLIPMYYTVPDPVHTRTMGVAFRDLQEFLAEKPRGIVDELTLVESAFRTRAIRQRTRPENPIVNPVTITLPDANAMNDDTDLRDVS